MLYVEEVWLVRGRTLEEMERFDRQVRPKLAEHLWPKLSEFMSSTEEFHVFLHKIDPERHGDPRDITNSVVDHFQLH